MRIKESIVVEGKDDAQRVSACVQADIIKTSGYGLNATIYKRLDEAYKRNNLIIFTDPDHVGERIRTMLQSRYPRAKHAFISRDEAMLGKDVGIENASCETICRALSKLQTLVEDTHQFSKSDMILCDLEGSPRASKRRELLGDYLGIGYGNAGQFLKRLNHFGITRALFLKGLEYIDAREDEPSIHK